ncbi:50S ribosomal protein L18 [Candidatus Calescamantes bacterium]|nr:50S ribosomal protein L18 [Candidatus Calescamantes bacterium]HDO71283.1 50S ribosomal protein L18 [bacterium]HEX68291.1 50S ribosomal protein L18 [bacterium]
MALTKEERRKRRHRRVRKKVYGTAERPRLCVFRSLKHIYAQIINDDEGRVLVAASSLSPEFKATGKKGGNVEGAREVGRIIGRKALEKGIEKVVFDRAGYKYHGRVKALAEGAREAGLKF